VGADAGDVADCPCPPRRGVPLDALAVPRVEDAGGGTPVNDAGGWATSSVDHTDEVLPAQLFAVTRTRWVSPTVGLASVHEVAVVCTQGVVVCGPSAVTV
jgi:hypothetical protein